MNRKKILFIGLVLLATLSCNDKDEETFMSSGIILGPDMRECICCGGYQIEISDTTFSFDSIPASSKIDLSKESYPLAVQLDWDYDRICGSIQYISVTRIRKE